MSETLVERIKYISGVQPDHLMSAFASDLNEIVTRAEAAEARADTFSGTIETLVKEKAQAEIELNVWKARALSAEALRHGAEAERDELARKLEQAQREIYALTTQLGQKMTA